jgi:hypothetical protein
MALQPDSAASHRQSSRDTALTLQRPDCGGLRLSASPTPEGLGCGRLAVPSDHEGHEEREGMKCDGLN